MYIFFPGSFQKPFCMQLKASTATGRPSVDKEQ